MVAKHMLEVHLNNSLIMLIILAQRHFVHTNGFSYFETLQPQFGTMQVPTKSISPSACFDHSSISWYSRRSIVAKQLEEHTLNTFILCTVYLVLSL
jgi:hypothetical protein